MTPVSLKFVLPNGDPMVGADVEILLGRASHTANLTGITMPRPITFTTDADGEIILQLWPSTTAYYIQVLDAASDAGIFYKFIVPEAEEGLTLRLQDLVIDAPMSGVFYDDAALLLIESAKANAIAAWLAAVGAQEAAEASAESVGADAAAAALSAFNADVSADIALAAQVAAELAAAAGAGSAGSASTSAGAAASSASAAAGSATAAATSATNAATSASGAATSAATATTQAGNAATSAAAALASETAAAGSATAAAGSATAAAGSATTAAGSATTAGTHATNAGTSETNAAASASAAAASAIASDATTRVSKAGDTMTGDLEVTSANRTGTSGVGIVEIRSTDSQAIDKGGSLALGGYSTGTSVATHFGAIGGRKENGTSANLAGYLALGVNDGTSIVERLRISSQGIVGIGTTPQTWGYPFGDANEYKGLELATGGMTLYSAPLSGHILNNAYYGAATWKRVAVGATSMYTQQSGAHVWIGDASGAAAGNVSMTERMRLDVTGSLGIGNTASVGQTLRLGRNITGAVTSYGAASNGVVQSDVTTAAYGYSSSLGSQNAVFTLTALKHFGAAQGTKGASSTITSQYGFAAESTLTGATNNYGFHSNIASGTGRWNFYAAGDAKNFFAGIVGIGATATNPTSNLTLGSTADTYNEMGINVSSVGRGVINFNVNTGINMELAVNATGSTDSWGLPTQSGGLATLGAHPLVFATNQTARMRIDSSGYVLIGTAAPVFGAANRGVLEVNGTSSAIVGLQVGGLSAGWTYHDGTDMSLTNTKNGGLNFGANGAKRMEILPAGNVGIGTAGTVQASGLEIVASSMTLLLRNTSSSGYAGMRIYNDQNSALRALEIDYYGSAYSGGESGNISCTGAYPLNFYTTNIHRMRLTAAGDLLVGPDTTTSSYTSSGRGVLEINGTSALMALKYNNAPAAYLYSDGTNGYLNAVLGGLNIQTNNQTRIAISSGGDVQIGDTGAAAPITTLVGTGRPTLRYTSNGQTWNVALKTDSSHNYYMISNNTETVGVWMSPGASGWNNLSDVRAKQDWLPIDNALDKLETLDVGTFSWIKDSSLPRDVGVKAQQVLAVLPEAVDTTDPEALGVRYTHLVPLLIKAVQELSARVRVLEAN